MSASPTATTFTLRTDRYRAWTLLALLLSLALGLRPALAQPVLYVDADAVGNADGSSWSNAFNQLNRALEAAGSAAQIWVAEGTYYPTTGSDRTATFYLKNNVVLYGGFQGGETARDQRNPDPLTNKTVLSGNIASEDEADDNSYHVVSAIDVDDTAVVDGFTITGGYADGSGQHNRGGGLTNWDGGSSGADNEGFPVLRNVRFTNNFAEVGGAIYLNTTTQITRLEALTFESNTADRGGALYANGEVDLEESTFTENTARDQGGALWIWRDASFELEDLTFEGNTAVNDGGAVFSSGELEIEDAVFTDNEAFNGRGGALYSTGSATLVGIRLTGNEAEEEGGGLASLGGRLILVQAYLAGNDGRWGGGLWCGGGSTCDIVNAVFVDGGADEAGGGIHNSGSALTLTNATVTANEQGGYTADGTTFGRLSNTIFWGNETVQIQENAAQVRSSLVEGGYSGGTSVLAEDPRFLRAPFTGGDEDLGDLRLQISSPALDFGDNTFLPQDNYDLDEDDITGETLPLDLNGAVRVQGGRVDLGAYEGYASAVATEEATEQPRTHSLAANYPNPFNPATTLQYTLAEPAHVTLRVFDLLGREVALLADGMQAAGTHTLAFDATGLAGGVYLYRLEAGAFQQTRTMTLVK